MKRHQARDLAKNNIEPLQKRGMARARFRATSRKVPATLPLNVLQQKAEKLFEQYPKRRTSAADEVQELTRKLSVQQIKLEMQNDELRRSQLELEAAREKYFDLYDLAPVAYLSFNENGLVVEANLTTFSLLGINRADLLNNSIVPFLDEASQEIFYHHRREVFRAKGRVTCELTLKKKDGSTFPAQLHSAALISGERPVIRTILMDITERKLAQERLGHVQKMEAIGTLAGGIAHDFNNVLAAIIGFTEMLLDDVSENAQAQYKLGQVLKAGLRGRELVRQILAFSRKTEGERRETRLTHVVQETHALLRASLPSFIRMPLAITTSDDYVIADPTQLEQVIMNLATNSAHAMREGGGELSIGISSVTFTQVDYLPDPDIGPGEYVVLTVKDTGTGMTEDVRRRAFEPFFTTKEQGVGTGMGLAVVYGIVKSHGGAITVQSKPGKGSTFEVFLPRTQRPEIAKEETATAALPVGSERILFVDDEEMLVDMAKGMLQNLGYDVTVRQNSLDAWRLFSADPSQFDLIITDQTMPDLTGIRLARKMLGVRKRIPIILCTGYSETVSAERAKQAGIRAFVLKPLARRELAETVRRVLDTCRA